MRLEDILAMQKRMDEILRPTKLLQDKLRIASRPELLGDSHWHRQTQIMGMVDGQQRFLRARAIYGASVFNQQFGTARTVAGLVDSSVVRAARGLADHSNFQAAALLAEKMKGLAVPPALHSYKAASDALAEHLSLLDVASLPQDNATLNAFSQNVAMSNAFMGADRVDQDLIEATREYSATSMPDLGTLGAHRAFLDASGLWLPRWPRPRLLSAVEKRRRLKARLQRNAQPRHVRRATSLVHRYERVLREIIDAAMSDCYGEEWADERLPQCGCTKLLKRVAAEGGDPLEHADYDHYRLIMVHPEHFTDVFSMAFDDPDGLADLIGRARRLRARSHHARDFGPEDLRDLRVVWRTIEAGLLALTDDMVFDHDLQDAMAV